MTDIKCLIIVVLIIISIVGIIAGLSYYRGVCVTTEKYEKLIREKELEVQLRIQEMQQEQNVEVKQYLIRVAELESEYEKQVEELKNAQFKDAIISPSIPATPCNNKLQSDKGNSGRVQKTKSESDLVCYTREEIQRKVARSLAITNEADKLVEQYKALLEICGKE